MVNKIITGISQKLDSEFNSVSDYYEIYTEEVKQDFQEPCFFITLLSLDQSQIVGNRYSRVQPFDIHYFPSTPDINTELNEVTEKLMNTLEYITVDENLIRGTKMKAETVDSVLHFFVNYNIHVIKEVIKEETMGEIKITQELGSDYIG
jgi:hypothetical protein